MFFENYNLTPKDMYNAMDSPKLIVSNQKEKSISIQRVNLNSQNSHMRPVQIQMKVRMCMKNRVAKNFA